MSLHRCDAKIETESLVGTERLDIRRKALSLEYRYTRMEKALRILTCANTYGIETSQIANKALEE